MLNVWSSISEYTLLLSFVMYVVFYYRTKPMLDVLFLVPFVSYFLLFIAKIFEVPFSYLEDDTDASYYLIVVFLDFVAYVTLFLSLMYFSPVSKILNNSKRLSYRIIFFLGLVLIIVNIAIVLPYFGQPYAVITTKHTPLSEIGWVLVAIFVVVNVNDSKINLYCCIVAVFVLVSLPFGARMQPSFGVISILCVMSMKGYKHLTLMCFIGLTVSSLFIGILRDLYFDSFEISSILNGFNQGAIFRTSSVILQFYNQTELSDQLINTLGTILLYPFTGTTIVGPEIYLNFELEAFKGIQGNGGNFGTLAYYYFGPIFPFIIFVCILAFSRLSYLNFIIVFMIVTSFRWQQYNIIPLLKVLPMIMLLIMGTYLLPKKQRSANEKRNSGGA